MQALLLTSSQQKVAKCYEDVSAGRYRIKASPSVVDMELQAAADKQQQIIMSVKANTRVAASAGANTTSVICSCTVVKISADICHK